jgi:hypothetical protein
MGDVYHALAVLNRTMNLGLTGDKLLAAEIKFKVAVANRQGETTSATALAEGFETVVSLKPRSRNLSLRELTRFARNDEMGEGFKNPPHVDEGVDKALE